MIQMKAFIDGKSADWKKDFKTLKKKNREHDMELFLLMVKTLVCRQLDGSFLWNFIWTFFSYLSFSFSVLIDEFHRVLSIWNASLWTCTEFDSGFYWKIEFFLDFSAIGPFSPFPRTNFWPLWTAKLLWINRFFDYKLGTLSNINFKWFFVISSNPHQIKFYCHRIKIISN